MTARSLLLLAATLVTANIAVQAHAQSVVDISGTTAHSTLVPNGLPLTGTFSFDETQAQPEYSGTDSNGIDFAAFTAPGSAEFTVDGQTYSYSLADIELNTAGVILFRYTNPDSTLFIFDATSNTNISSVPGSDALTSFLFLNDVFPQPDGSIGYIAADLPRGVPEPATWALMLFGFGAVGFLIRRTRHSQSRQFDHRN